MKEVKRTVDRKVQVKLTDEQLKLISKTLGEDVVKRMSDITVSQTAGFVDSVIVIN